MGERIKRAGSALAFAAAYFFAYKFAWSNSADQFFLPAGVRIAALLFLPYRFWPGIFLGDAAAMLSLRVPMIDAHGISAIWAYGSSLLICPIVALAPFLVRRYSGGAQLNHRLLPAILFSTAAWGVCVSTSLNAVLGYPLPINVPAYLYKFSIGQYLAILIAVLPAVLWIRRPETMLASAPLIKHSAIGVALLLCAYYAADASAQPWQRLVLLGCMVIPVLVLTALHGWRGAAVGIVVADLALGFSVPTTSIFGNQDSDVFVVQQTFAVMSTFMLVVGSMLSTTNERAHRRIASSAIQLQTLARAQDMQHEKALRARAEAIAAAQTKINAAYRETVQRLKAQGQYELAMQVNSQSLASTQMLYDQAAALYPFRVEKVGLYATLLEGEFYREIAGAHVSLILRGDLINHSATLQLAAYRCICLAIDMLPAMGYKIHARAWSLRGERGISVTVSAEPDIKSIGSKSSKAAAAQLEAKMRAYGGASKRRRRSVFFLLADGERYLARGTTIHDVPLALSRTLTVKSSEL